MGEEEGTLQNKEERFRITDLVYLVPIFILAVIGLISLGPVIWLSLTMMQTLGVENALLMFFITGWVSITGCGLLKWWDAVFSPVNLRWKWLAILILFPIAGALVFFFVNTNRKPKITLAADNDPQ